ncbi:MAG: 50S ribosomal protein L22 [Candidatus Brocadiaceae bacterium]|jgi:large subunit ribosomal protein L22
MEFRASHRYAPITPTKVRPVVDLIRGKHVNDALQILRATPNRGAHLVDRVLQSAMANADQSLEADMENLRVQKAWVDGGPIRRKVRPAPRLRRSIIRSQSSHINIVLDDGQ